MTISREKLSTLPILLAALSLVLATPVTAQTYANLHSFANYPTDGANPMAGLVQSGNTLYGTTASGGNLSSLSGAVFKVNTDGSGYTNLYFFTPASYPNYPHTNSDGASPEGGLILVGTNLYGTANIGGPYGYGTVFRLGTDGLNFTNLYSFTGGNDGAQPQAGLILAGKTLYGTTTGGGTQGDGAVFAINIDGSNFTNLYSFMGGSDGAISQAGLILSGNILYGTAESGGNLGNGTVFAIQTNGMGFTNLYDFSAGAPNDEDNITNSDGANPMAGLILSGNTLYGTANVGGLTGNGTVFAINTDGSNFTNLYSFSDIGDYNPNSDGAQPQAGLLLAGKTLYGTADWGGTAADGAVFAINTDGTDFTNLFSFDESINGGGAHPMAGLLISGGNLIGTTYTGGTSINGTVFTLSVAVTPLPQLIITQAGTNVVLTWSDDDGIFNLETTTNLDPAVWTVVSGQDTVTNAISGRQRFFRLSQ